MVGTRCVCIIRHKKGIKNPKVYEVKIKQLEDNTYHFIKGNEILDNAAKVISERNELIYDNKVGNDLEKYFLIVEYEIPLFKNDFEKYSDFFEFIDLRGLNEFDNIYLKEILPLIQINIKFSLFIFKVDNFDSLGNIEIVNSYINSPNKKKDDEENYAITESFKESIFILNKIDLIEPKEKKKVE